jgi:hypothetical protein
MEITSFFKPKLKICIRNAAFSRMSPKTRVQEEVSIPNLAHICIFQATIKMHINRLLNAFTIVNQSSISGERNSLDDTAVEDQEGHPNISPGNFVYLNHVFPGQVSGISFNMAIGKFIDDICKLREVFFLNPNFS